MRQKGEIWGGCRVSTPTADYWHAATDFATETICGINFINTLANLIRAFPAKHGKSPQQRKFALQERYSTNQAMCPKCASMLSRR